MFRSFEGRINGRALVGSWVFGDSDSDTEVTTGSALGCFGQSGRLTTTFWSTKPDPYSDTDTDIDTDTDGDRDTGNCAGLWKKLG